MQHLPVGDLEMHYVDTRPAGATGESPVVLLVHGFPLDHSMWSGQLEGLGDQFRMIAPDLRGFGRTGGAGMVTTMEQMADDLAGMLDALQIDSPIVFCGLSMGGYVGWQFVRKYRDRVCGLVQCDTRAAADSAEAIETRLKMAAHVLEYGTAAVAEAMPAKMFAASSLSGRREIVAATRQVIVQSSPQAIAAAQRGMAERPDVTDSLAKIDLPVLCMVGEHDAISPPEEMQSIAEALPHGKLATIGDAGHMAPLENPAAVNAVLRDFVGRL